MYVEYSVVGYPSGIRDGRILCSGWRPNVSLCDKSAWIVLRLINLSVINQSVNQNTPTQHRMSQANHRGECKQSSQYAMSNSSLFSLRVNVLISYKYMYVCLARRVLIAMLSWYWLPPLPGAQRKGSYGECWVSNLFWN